MLLNDRYPDLDDLIKGSSYAQLFNLLYALALVRYADKDLLNSYNSKLGTVKKLSKLAGLGYIEQYPNGVSVITAKSLEILKANGYNTEVISKKLTGDYGQHQAVISSVIFRIMKEPDFYSVFYPQFKREGEPSSFLIPDACLVYRNKDKKARLVFLEVEEKKPDWEKYLVKKRDNYLELAKDFEIYDKWWRKWAHILRLSLCPLPEFCFSVLCVGKFKADWEGWTFGD